MCCLSIVDIVEPVKLRVHIIISAGPVLLEVNGLDGVVIKLATLFMISHLAIVMVGPLKIVMDRREGLVVNSTLDFMARLHVMDHVVSVVVLLVVDRLIVIRLCLGESFEDGMFVERNWFNIVAIIVVMVEYWLEGALMFIVIMAKLVTISVLDCLMMAKHRFLYIMCNRYLNMVSDLTTDVDRLIVSNLVSGMYRLIIVELFHTMDSVLMSIVLVKRVLFSVFS